MSWFTTGLAKATNWLDTTVGTANLFGGGKGLNYAAMAGVSYATGFYNDYIKDSFLEETAINFATGAATNALTGGQQQQGTPMPVQKGVSAGGSSVNTRLGGPGQVQAYSGTNNARVQDAYRKLNQSSNPSIQSALNVVRPNIARRGPTKSLQEAKIGSLRS